MPKRGLENTTKTEGQIGHERARLRRYEQQFRRLYQRVNEILEELRVGQRILDRQREEQGSDEDFNFYEEFQEIVNQGADIDDRDDIEANEWNDEQALRHMIERGNEILEEQRAEGEEEEQEEEEEEQEEDEDEEEDEEEEEEQDEEEGGAFRELLRHSKYPHLYI